jgi:magnesium transporter
MLRLFRRGVAGFETAECGPEWRLPGDTVWVDLVQPTRDEELKVEEALGLSLPTPEEASAIEPSSRLYQQNDATYITAFVLVNSETDHPDTAPVTFVLTQNVLATIRYGDPRAFKVFAAQAERQPSLCATAVDTFLNLLDAIVDRTADVLERVNRDVDGISRAVFAQPRPTSFENCLYQLGRAQMLNAEIRESLASIDRASSFAALAAPVQASREHHDHIKTVTRDARSLGEQSDALSGNIGFLLNAALGFINIEQNENARTFSLVATLFLPMTLIASIYGMNFEHMPELHWRYGYAWALGLMVISLIISLVLFHRRRWIGRRRASARQPDHRP